MGKRATQHVKLDPAGAAERKMRKIEKTATAIAMLDMAIGIMEKISVECSGDEALQRSLTRFERGLSEEISRQLRKYDRLKGIR